MIKQKQILATLFLGILMISMMSAVSAATMSSPAANGYYKTTLFPVTITSAGNNITNVSCYYNASGGAATVLFVTSLNTTADQQTFSALSGSTLAEGATFNVSCILQNSSLDTLTRLSAAGIKVDGTNPSLDIAEDDGVFKGRPINYKCTDTYMSTFTVSDGTTSTNLLSGLTAYTQFVPATTGSYVFTCTDLSGNSATQTVAVTTSDGFAQPPIAMTQGQFNFQQLLQNKVAWLIVGVILLYFFVNKK